MTDLTKITTPFGLLDRETQEALKAHPGAIEAFMVNGAWEVSHDPSWYPSMTYRVKPAPLQPREVWINEYEGRLGNNHFSTKEEADETAREGRIRVVHFREVIE